MPKKNIFFVIGVSGCGKSTVGKLLAEEMNLPFFDGDDFHSSHNIQKMSTGKALNDHDRQDWLGSLNALALRNSKQGAVIACSALKKSYRRQLSMGLLEKVQFIFLEGSFETIQQRLQTRNEHFMPSSLLRSQFDALEVPSEALQFSIELSPREIVSKIKELI